MIADMINSFFFRQVCSRMLYITDYCGGRARIWKQFWCYHGEHGLDKYHQWILNQGGVWISMKYARFKYLPNSDY